MMCIVIFSGKRKNRLWEIGMDIFEEAVGDVSDEDYFTNNNGNDFPEDQPELTRAKSYHTSQDGAQRDP